MDYKKAGVDIEAGYKSVELMKEHVKRTMREEVLGGLGGFSGAFSLKKIKEMEDPVLLSGTDGCGTKVKLAMIMDKHDTIGIDAVAMCVNDIACAGGEPLFFLDYIACGKNYPEKIAQIVSGVAEGCVQSDAVRWWYDPYLYSVQKLTPVKLFLGLRSSESGERYLSVDGTNLLRRNPGQPGRVSQTGRLRILSDLPENHASVK